MNRLTTIAQADEAIDSDAPVLIYKHSTQCPISAAAKEEVSMFEQRTEMPVHIVHVIENRDVSNHIAEATGVQHESPQALISQQGEVLWAASHQSITADSLREAEERIEEER